MTTPRSSTLNRDYELDPRRSGSRDAYGSEQQAGREISLGTGTILGIFFALALTCGVFFGFGYSMGRKSSQPDVTPAQAPQSTDATDPTAAKPSPGSAFKAAASLFAARPIAAEAPQTEVAGTDHDSGEAPAHQASSLSSTAKPTLIRASANASPDPAPAAEAPLPAASADGTSIVQVAAVSHQEDAELLLSALKQRGYAVFVRQEPQDHLLHVQVGPFASHRDADIVRQRLLADGYNAILK